MNPIQPEDSDRLIGNPPRYRIEKRLGGGGMGDVFLATDTKLGQLVALKLLKESLVQAGDIKKRFERECAICAALKSEHIVQVIDYGLTPEGNPFFVMEYLQGQTLGQLLRRQHRLGVAQTIQLVTQICAGLQLAHEGVTLWSEGKTSAELIKVIHCDLKPDNIFLVSTAVGDLAKIIDFGIAKIRYLQAEQTSVTNMFFGTCHYAAPEQLKVASDLDERADIYSLGMILYQMLTGTDPFGLDCHKNKVSAATWANAHISQLPQPMWVKPDCEDLPPELEAVVIRCLQKSPQDRFASVKELSQALQKAFSSSENMSPSQFSTSGQTQASAHSTQTRGSEYTRTSAPLTGTVSSNINPLRQRNVPVRKLLLVGGAILLALATVVYYWQSNRSRVGQQAADTQLAAFSLAKTLAGHENSVWSVDFSFDGQKIVSGSEDNTIKVWNTDGQLIRTLSGHTEAVRAVKFSLDGQKVASGSSDTTIKLWDLPTGQNRTFSGHSSSVWSIAISNDGKTLVSGSEDQTIKVWDIPTGEIRRILFGHSGPVYSVALSPDGQIASAGFDKTIKIWNMRTGELLHTLEGHSDAVRCVVFSPNGQQLASSSWDKTIKVWQPHTGKLLHTLEGHSDRAIAVAYSNDGQIASADLGKTIKIWNSQTGRLLQTLKGHSDWVLSVDFNPSRQTLVSGSKDKTVKIWQR